MFQACGGGCVQFAVVQNDALLCACLFGYGQFAAVYFCQSGGIGGHGGPHGFTFGGVAADKAVHQGEGGVAPHAGGNDAVDFDLGDDDVAAFDAVHGGGFDALFFAAAFNLAGVGDFLGAVYLLAVLRLGGCCLCGKSCCQCGSG